MKIGHPAVIRLLCSIPNLHGLVLDAEHGAFGDSDFETLCALINLTGKVSVVRAPDSNTSTVSRLLDRGAQAIMIPRVRSRVEVIEAIRGAYHPPAGVRGYDPTVSASSYGAVVEARAPRIIIQIETAEALADVRGIADLEQVTDIFVGPADLGRALRASEDAIFAPEVIRAMERIASAVSNKSVQLGAYVDSPERAAWAISLGYSFLAIGSDTSFLRSAVSDWTTVLSGE